MERDSGGTFDKSQDISKKTHGTWEELLGLPQKAMAQHISGGGQASTLRCFGPAALIEDQPSQFHEDDLAGALARRTSLR